MSRINIIRETSFLVTAYMLADGLVCLVLALLITTRTPSAETGYVNAAVFSCLFLCAFGAQTRAFSPKMHPPQDANPRRPRASSQPRISSPTPPDLSIMIRDIDDPFGYSAKHNERMLVAERLIQPPLRDFFFTASSIDFSLVFAGFGARLHKDMKAHGVDVGAIYAASNAESGEALQAGANSSAAATASDDNLLRPEVVTAMVPGACPTY
jgi:hypothetical protein